MGEKEIFGLIFSVIVIVVIIGFVTSVKGFRGKAIAIAMLILAFYSLSKIWPYEGVGQHESTSKPNHVKSPYTTGDH